MAAPLATAARRAPPHTSGVDKRSTRGIACLAVDRQTIDRREEDESVVLQRPETLTNAVVRYISEAILRGEFAPGQPLPEVHLADHMGTSRSTVREASRTLAEQ